MPPTTGSTYVINRITGQEAEARRIHPTMTVAEYFDLIWTWLEESIGMADPADSFDPRDHDPRAVFFDMRQGKIVLRNRWGWHTAEVGDWVVLDDHNKTVTSLPERAFDIIYETYEAASERLSVDHQLEIRS